MAIQKILAIIATPISILFGILSIPQMFPEILHWSVSVRLLILLLALLALGGIIFLIYKYSTWIVYIKKISNNLAYILYLLIFHPIARVLYITIILIAIIIVSKFYYPIITLCGTAFVIILFSLKQFPLQEYQASNHREMIFDDDFLNNKGWFLNYWGNNQSSKNEQN